MPNHLPPAPAKGTRHPGAGRVKGTPNKVTVEARRLIGELVESPIYQRRFRRDFEARKVHPTIESMVWAYFLGRPRLDVNVTGAVDVTVNARIEEERRIYASLDLRDLEQLAAESQALVDRAQALAKARTAEHDAETPPHIDKTAEVSGLPEVSSELLTKCLGADNVDYGYLDRASTEAPSSEAPGVDSGGNLSSPHGTTLHPDHKGKQ